MIWINTIKHTRWQLHQKVYIETFGKSYNQNAQQIYIKIVIDYRCHTKNRALTIYLNETSKRVTFY